MGCKKIGILVLRCSDSRNRAVDLVSNGSKVELSIKKDQKSIHRFWTSLCLGDTGAQIVFLENNYSETMVENEFWCLMVYTAVLEYQKLFVWWAMMKTKPNEHHSGPRSRKRVSVVWGLVVSRSNLFCIATWSESGWFGYLICMHYPHKSFPGRKTHLLAGGNVYGRCVYRTVVAKLADRHFQHSRLYFWIVISKIWHLLCSSAEAQRGSNLMNRSDFFFIVNL